MSLAVLHSRALTGIEAPPVRVETHLANGLPVFTIVGLADTGVRESRERVRAAILNSGFEFPNRRITVNLAPADLPKESGYRLVSFLVSNRLVVRRGQLPHSNSLHSFGADCFDIQLSELNVVKTPKKCPLLNPRLAGEFPRKRLKKNGS